ncbi:hypothetical protein C1645_828919 [Glomus cerebriforme]|uniref:F-box domain-containing protein n=1 Tax=Glomus cerebriforme TaxID=658196 RepID=A0A397SUX0_9GLOM|nr:hypothetical protein C1645_828919 [Glomus cerebriforme]
MACSKIFSGELPELLNEIIHYFYNDFSTLYSCILINRICCRLAIPLLWEDPFSIPTENYHFIRIYLYNLNDDDKTKLIEYGINNDLIPSNTLFNYPSFIKSLNTWKIIYFIEKWVKNVGLRFLTTDEQPFSQSLLSYPNSDQKLNSTQIKDISKCIYNTLLKPENNINLFTLEITTIRGIDHDHFKGIFELILKNSKLIRNIKNLKISFNESITYNFLKYLYFNCKSISILYFHYKINYDDILITNYSSGIINSQQNLKKILFGYYIYDSILLSLKNSNCSNTLKTLVFYNLNLKNLNNFNQVFDQLNVLESIHFLYCSFSNCDFIKQIINPFKLRSLFIRENFQIENFKILLQKSGDYLENIGLLKNELLNQQLIEMIIKYCKKIKFFDLSGFNDQNIYFSLDLIKFFNENLNHLTINFDSFYMINQSIDDINKLSLILLKELGQNLPLKLEYLDLSLSINGNIFEIFLKNSQDIFIKKLLIKNKIQEDFDDFLPHMKDYLMKKKRIKYFALRLEYDNSTEKCKELFSLNDEVKKFELYDIKVQNYDDLKIQHYNYIDEIFRYGAILAAKHVSNDAYKALIERLPTLEELKNSIKRINVQILTDYIEPLEIIPLEIIINAYRHIALLNNMYLSDIRGMSYIWDESTCGSNLIIKNNGKVIFARSMGVESQGVRAKMILKNNNIYEWNIIIEKRL